MKADQGMAPADRLLAGYDRGPFFCELTSPRPDGQAELDAIRDRLDALDTGSLRRRTARAEQDLFDLGITFTVYSDKDAIDRILPFDVIPRVITAGEWAQLEAGIVQRVTAINLFLHDIYHDARILADKVVPAELVLGNANYHQIMRGVDVPCGAYSHVCGIDLIRDQAGRWTITG